ncbi:hypothetical protein D9M68_373700 [compost metagenome]
MHRTAGGDRALKHPVHAPVFDEGAGEDVRLRAVLGGFLEKAAFGKRGPLRFGQVGFDQFGGEIRRRRNQHQAGDTVSVATLPELLDDPQRNPAAHRRADQHDAARRRPINDRKALLEPARDRAIGEGAAGGAVTGIVEAHAGRAPFHGIALDLDRLGAGHVRTIASEPDQRRLPGGLLRVAYAHRDPALSRIRADLDEADFRLGWRIVHARNLQKPV